MELDIRQQALCLLWGLGLGFALGLVYRLLRLCRIRTKKHWPFDALFALICFFTAFLYGMYRAGGRLGLWEMAALSAGFCSFMTLFKAHLPGRKNF